MRRSSALALAALLLAAIACPGAAPDLGPRLDAVEPAFGDLGGPTSVLIRGQFRVAAVQALSQASGDAVDATYQAWLDGAPLGQVRWLDERTLAAVVPGGLVEGPHRLDVQDPTGRRGALAGAFFAGVPTVALAQAVSLSRATLSVGQGAIISVAVTNGGNALAHGVLPALALGGTGKLAVTADPAAKDIAPGATEAFDFGVTAVAPGDVAVDVATAAPSPTGGMASAPTWSGMALVQVPAALAVSTLSATPPSVSAGQVITLTMTVQNTGGADASNVAPGAPVASGTGAALLQTGPTPASLTVSGGQSRTFQWTFQAQGAGTITFGAGASGADANSGLPLAAGPATSGPVEVLRDGGPGAAPTVTSTLPANGATGVPLNLPISATFSQAMDPATLSATTFTVKQGTTNVSGAVTVNGAAHSATFTPASPLGLNLLYTATITTGAKDSGGLALAANYSWSFTAAASAGPPTVISTNPLDLATNICVPARVDATFDKLMDPLTINLTNFTLAGPGTSPVSGTVSYDGQTTTASFLPSSSLVAGTKYTATVSTGVKDAAGNGLALDKIWTFTPSATLCTPPINLRGIASYGVASRAGLTSTGVTVVNGNVALYPLATCTDATGNAGASQTCLVKTYVSPTGMTVNGSIFFAGDPFDNGGTANSVTNDLNLAWIEGKAKAVTNGTVAGDELSGKTFNAGVYHNANLGLAANGVATMDAQNDLNAVFIFQVDSSMTDSGTLLLPTQIKLVNGAQAKNIYFVAGLDVTIGSGTIWNGTILAGRTVTVNDGSTVNGRVLAGASGAGAFTLTGAASPSKTTITVPQ